MVPIHGAPYALKIASVTFELSTGEIKITKKSSDGIRLQGASFELLGNAGSVLATATTGTNGVAVFEDLMPGLTPFVRRTRLKAMPCRHRRRKASRWPLA